MKKLLYILSINLLFLSNVIANSQVNHEDNLVLHLKAIKEQFVENYKDDAVAQSALKLDANGIEKTTDALDSTKVFSIEKEQKDLEFKSVVSCDYIGLAYGSLTVQLLELAQKDPNDHKSAKKEMQAFLDTAKALKNKGVNTQNYFVWDKCILNNGSWAPDMNLQMKSEILIFLIESELAEISKLK